MTKRFHNLLAPCERQLIFTLFDGLLFLFLPKTMISSYSSGDYSHHYV